MLLLEAPAMTPSVSLQEALNMVVQQRDMQASRAQKAESQITLLKEKLVNERYWRLFSHLKDGMDQARDQLRAEMPEVTW